jgi:hypothetical protein
MAKRKGATWEELNWEELNLQQGESQQ